MTSGLHENDECMRRFAYFSFWPLLMLHEIDECMKRFAYFSFWGLLMLSENDECMHRFAYFSFRCLLMLHGSHTCNMYLINFLMVFAPGSKVAPGGLQKAVLKHFWPQARKWFQEASRRLF